MQKNLMENIILKVMHDMENFIMEHWNDIVYIVHSSRSTNEANSRLQRQLEIGYLKAQQILAHPIIQTYIQTNNQ